MTKICYQLQGFFGRTATNMIETGYIEEDGTINWETIENDIEK